MSDIDGPLAADLLRLADEELFVGHVLTSVAGWGPELELNLAMSSMGQDEIGHARLLYGLVAGTDPAAVNSLVYDRPIADFDVSALSTVYTDDWATLVVKHLLYELADAQRVDLMATCPVEPVAAIAARMRHEETYHLDFWTLWFDRTLDVPDGPERLQQALDDLWPSARELFGLRDNGGLVSRSALDAAEQRWTADLRARCEARGLALRDGPALPAATERILDEMRLVYSAAPGRW